MKLKSILSAAVLTAVLATTTCPASITTGVTANAVEQGRQIAAENGIVLSTDEAAASLTVLNNAGNGSLPTLEFSASGNVTCITGPVSDRTVSGRRDAKSVVRSVSALLGITDFDAEIMFDECQTSMYNNVYIFRQVYRGISVENGFISLVVDKDTEKAQYLNSTYAAGLSFDVTPAISANLARALIREAAGTGVTEEPELLIRMTEKGIYKLAWRGFTGSSDAEAVYIDAQTGDLLNTVSNSGATITKSFDARQTPNPVLGACQFTATIQKTGSGSNTKYTLHDPSRHIWVGSEAKMTAETLTGETGITDSLKRYYAQTPDALWMYYSQQVKDKTLTSDTLFAADNGALGTLVQVEKAYDFYSNRFGWDGTDGNDAELFVNAGSFKGSSASEYMNYISLGIPTTFQFGGKPDAYELDCVVHEYTHRVSAVRAKWSLSSQTTEAGALNEGYSDIMGEYGHLRDWKTLAGTDRNARLSPSNGKKTLSYSSDPQYCSYQYYNLKPYLEDQRNLSYNGYIYYIDCHNASTIISHAAYLMENYGIPASICREVWFNSMDYLPKGADFATFNSCRNAVVNCALEQVLSKYSSSYSAATRNNYKAYARMAFNAVGIKLSYRKMGDVNFDGRVTSDDVNLITKIVRGYYTPDVETKAIADVSYDGRITNEDAETISRAILYGTTSSL